MNKNLIFSLCVVGGVSSPSLAMEEQYPDEFSDLFRYTNEIVSISIFGVSSKVNIDATINAENFKFLENNQTEKNKLKRYLAKQSVKKEVIDQIVEDLSKGVNIDNVPCEVTDRDCKPIDIPGKPDYLFNFEKPSLEIFISPDMVNGSSGKKQYYQPYKENNALINWTNVSFNTGTDTQTNYLISNDAVLGLGAGRLKLDVQYESDSQQFDTYNAYYEYEHLDLKTIFGYLGQNTLVENATEILQFNANQSQFGISVSTHDKLLKNRTTSLQNLYFYSPETATLEIKRGNQVILTQLVSAGQQSISYNKLPTGVYTITLTLRAADREIYSEQRQIVNSSNYELPVDDYDFNLNFGYLEDLNEETTYGNIANEDRLFYNAAFAYRPTEPAILAIGTMFNKTDTLLQLGGRYAFNSFLDVQSNVNLFAHGAQVYSGQVNLGNAYVSYTKYNVIDDVTTLSDLIYGKHDGVEIGGGISYELFGGFGFINYFQYNYTDHVNPSLKSKNVDVSWGRDLFGGKFDISVAYNESRSNNNSEVVTSLSWSKRFGNNISGRVASHFNDEDFDSIDTTLTHSTKYKNTNIQTSVSASIDRDNETDSELYSSLDGNTEHFNYYAYGYINDKGRKSFSGNLSGTQVLTLDSFNMTNLRSEAYVNVKPEYPEDEIENSWINYGLLIDNKSALTGKVYENNSLLAMRPYSYAEFQFNMDDTDNQIKEDSFERFMLPGKLHQYTTKVDKLKSKIVILSNTQNEPVLDAFCQDLNCVKIEALSNDGVYRLYYKEKIDFDILSEDFICIPDDETDTKDVLDVACLEGLDDRLTMSDEKPHRPDDYVLVDILDSPEHLSRMKRNIEKLKVTHKIITINNLNYVYVKNADKLKLNKVENEKVASLY